MREEIEKLLFDTCCVGKELVLEEREYTTRSQRTYDGKGTGQYVQSSSRGFFLNEIFLTAEEFLAVKKICKENSFSFRVTTLKEKEEEDSESLRSKALTELSVCIYLYEYKQKSVLPLTVAGRFEEAIEEASSKIDPSSRPKKGGWVVSVEQPSPLKFGREKVLLSRGKFSTGQEAIDFLKKLRKEDFREIMFPVEEWGILVVKRVYHNPI